MTRSEAIFAMIFGLLLSIVIIIISIFADNLDLKNLPRHRFYRNRSKRRHHVEVQKSMNGLQVATKV